MHGCVARTQPLAGKGRGRSPRQNPPRRHTRPLACSRRQRRRRGAAHAAAQRAERGKAFRGHGRQSLDAVGPEPLAGMARVPRTMRRFEDATSVVPVIAASGAEPELPSARGDWNARAILWGQLATYANALRSVEGWRLGMLYKSEREGAVGEW